VTKSIYAIRLSGALHLQTIEAIPVDRERLTTVVRYSFHQPFLEVYLHYFMLIDCATDDCYRQNFTIRVLKLRATADAIFSTFPPTASSVSAVAVATNGTEATAGDCLPTAIAVAIAAGVALLVTSLVAAGFAAYFCYVCKTTQRVIRMHNLVLRHNRTGSFPPRHRDTSTDGADRR
jgi:hypothetical protein